MLTTLRDGTIVTSWVADNIDALQYVPGAGDAADAIPACLARLGDMQDRAVAYCTRPPRHGGRHLSCAARDTVWAAWPGEHQPTGSDLDDPEDIAGAQA